MEPFGLGVQALIQGPVEKKVSDDGPHDFPLPNSAILWLAVTPVEGDRSLNPLPMNVFGRREERDGPARSRIDSIGERTSFWLSIEIGLPSGRIEEEREEHSADLKLSQLTTEYQNRAWKLFTNPPQKRERVFEILEAERARDMKIVRRETRMEHEPNEHSRALQSAFEALDAHEWTAEEKRRLIPILIELLQDGSCIYNHIPCDGPLWLVCHASYKSLKKLSGQSIAEPRHDYHSGNRLLISNDPPEPDYQTQLEIQRRNYAAWQAWWSRAKDQPIK